MTGKRSKAVRAAASSRSPAQSKRRRGPMPPDSDRKRQPMGRAATQNGTESTKMARQPKTCISRPPTVGPTAGASTMPNPNSPIARPRSSSGNTSNRAIIDSGCITPAAAPCSRRPAISASALQARRTKQRTGKEDGDGGDEGLALSDALDQPCRGEHGRRRCGEKPGGDPLHANRDRCPNSRDHRRKGDVDDRRGEQGRDAPHHRGGDDPSAVEGRRRRECAVPAVSGGRHPRPCRDRARGACKLVPGVAASDALGERVEPCQPRQQAGDRRRGHARAACSMRGLALAPDAGVAHGRADGRAARRLRRARRASACKSSPSCQSSSGRPSPAASSDGEDAAGARGIAGEPGLRELKHVEARDIGDCLLDRRRDRDRLRAAASRASRSPVARRAGCPRSYRRETAACRPGRAALAREPRRDPARQLRRARAGRRRSRHPRLRAPRTSRVLRRAVEPRQRDEQSCCPGSDWRRNPRARAHLRRRACRIGMRRSMSLRAPNRPRLRFAAVNASHLKPGSATSISRSSKPAGARRRGSRRRPRSPAAARRRARRRAAQSPGEMRGELSRPELHVDSRKLSGSPRRPLPSRDRFFRRLQPAHDLLHGVVCISRHRRCSSIPSRAPRCRCTCRCGGPGLRRSAASRCRPCRERGTARAWSAGIRSPCRRPTATGSACCPRRW